MSESSHHYVCTIIAKNYIAFARTLCASFLSHHPAGKCYVLLIDEIKDYVEPEKEAFEIISLSALGIPNLRDFCFKYDITELSTAVKPYLLKHLLEIEGVEKLLYLDPDILVTNSLRRLYDELNVQDIIVTPHLDEDYPNDGCMPNDSHIMKSGIFNLGFIGVRRSETADRFLRWWQNKLYDKCVIDHNSGYFVDQRYIDYAFVLFRNIAIVYDVGYNVAYWNLHSRKISYKNNQWMCNDGKLYFFHFSNFKPERSQIISGHQTRYQLSELPDLKRIFSIYNHSLIENGYNETKNWPYTYNDFSNLKELIYILKRLYRIHLKQLNLMSLFNFGLLRNLSRLCKDILVLIFNKVAHNCI